MYNIIINLNDKDEITNLKISEGKSISYSDLFDISGSLLGLVCTTILNGLSKSKDYTKEKSLQDRAALYDNLVLLISMISDTIYPEHKDLKGDPEKFVKFLDNKIKTLNDLEDNIITEENIKKLLDSLSNKELHTLIRSINTTLANRKVESKNGTK